MRNQFDQGLNWKKLKVYKPIKDRIKRFWDQWLLCKKC